jgi:hypothetical protein
LRPHIDNASVSDEVRARNDLAELGRHEYRGAHDRRGQQTHDEWKQSTHASSLTQVKWFTILTIASVTPHP